MRALADQFVAVAGQGQIREAMSGSCVAADATRPEDLHTADAVYLPRDRSLGTLLESICGGTG
ncbi:MAG: hypothetical protein ABEH56_06630 [Salinirussus sp.]